MIPFALLLFGLLSGCLVAVIVGMFGRTRTIGFGWTFLLSIIFTPLVGLVVALLSDPLPNSTDKRWGCMGTLLAMIGILLMIPFIAVLFMLLGVPFMM
ncbi:MAG: hypothetical protein SNH01_00240 [Rikenellaceae bacterium]